MSTIEETGISDEDLDLDLDPESPEPLPAEPASPEGEPSPADPKIAALEAQIASLKETVGKGDPNTAALVGMAQEFLKKQSAPKVDEAANRAAVAKFGEELQKALVVGTPEEAGTAVLRAIQSISQSNTDALVTKYGNPLSEKAADFTVGMFLSSKAETAGEAVHKAIAKNLTFTPEEKAWIGTAPAEDVHTYLNRRYEQEAGRVLLASHKKGSPKNIAGGQGGAASAGGLRAIPGMNARDAANLETLAANFWPDEKVRAAKIAAIAKSMNEGA